MEFVVAWVALVGLAIWVGCDVLSWYALRQRDGAEEWPWHWSVPFGGFLYFIKTEETEDDE